jgi:hypothetical protein
MLVIATGVPRFLCAITTLKRIVRYQVVGGCELHQGNPSANLHEDRAIVIATAARAESRQSALGSGISLSR